MKRASSLLSAPDLIGGTVSLNVKQWAQPVPSLQREALQEGEWVLPVSGLRRYFKCRAYNRSGRRFWKEEPLLWLGRIIRSPGRSRRAAMVENKAAVFTTQAPSTKWE